MQLCFKLDGFKYYINIEPNSEGTFLEKYVACLEIAKATNRDLREVMMLNPNTATPDTTTLCVVLFEEEEVLKPVKDFLSFYTEHPNLIEAATQEEIGRAKLKFLELSDEQLLAYAKKIESLPPGERKPTDIGIIVASLYVAIQKRFEQTQNPILKEYLGIGANKTKQPIITQPIATSSTHQFILPCVRSDASALPLERNETTQPSESKISTPLSLPLGNVSSTPGTLYDLRSHQSTRPKPTVDEENKEKKQKRMGDK